jgi:SAM-dependent methyltransferase
VLDISSRALEFARKRLGTKALGVEWYAEDVTRFQPPHGYWLWHDRAVFHFLTDAEDRRQYVKVLKQALQPGGHLIIATFADGGPAKCSGLDIVQYNAVRLMTELGEGFSMVEQTSEVHITPAKNEQKFNWFRLLRKPDTGLPISWTS